MKHSLKEDLIRYLAKNPVWHPKGEILLIDWKYQDGRSYMAPTADRKLREAESESRIAVKDDGKGSVCYKFLPPDKRSLYIPFSQRIEKDKLFRV